ncbi:MAG: hypothetical protein PHI40_06670 [Caldisericia bacterium]|nr:hypothetical protein [Caldisericia bacterium]MDD4615068.1 hypothetical protein [Caldisericia bacterium]
MKRIEKRLETSPSPPSCRCMFQCEKHGTTIWNEILAGLTTFLILSFSYYQSSVLLINSLTISGEYIPSIMAVMLLYTAILSIFAGFYLKRPVLYSISTGMTVFLTAGIFSSYNMSIASGFGILLVEGIVFLLLIFTGLPRWIVKQTPMWIQKGSPAILGSFLVLFAMLSTGLISLESDATFVSQTLRNPTILLFFFGFLLSLTLYYIKTKNSFLIAILITIFFGFILSKNSDSTTFRVSWLILTGYIAAWLMLFSILFDKNVKNALEKSLWILIGALFIGILLYSNPHSIILKPQQWFGNQGIFKIPSFSVFPIFVGSSVSTVGIFFSEISVFWAPFLSLLTFHFFLYVCMFYSIQSFVSYDDDTHSQQTLFSKNMITEGIASLCAGGSSLASLHSSTASPIHVAVGAKTGASSVAYGFMSLFSLFTIPLLSYVLLPITLAPFLLSVGIILIVHTLQSFETLALSTLVPLISTIVIAIVTMDIVQSLLVGIILYAVVASYQRKQVSFGFWMVVIVFFIFEFFRIVIPYFSI